MACLPWPGCSKYHGMGLKRRRSRTEKFWDALSGKTDSIARKYEPTYMKSIARSRKYLHSTDIVLDFACGTGLVCAEIADDVTEVVAIDISSKMIDIAKGKASAGGIGNIRFERSTIFDEKYTGGSLDAVLAFNILHLLKDSAAVVERINELLTDDGVFISSTECAGENMRSPINILVYLMIKLRLVPYMKFFKTGGLEKMVVDGGFQIVETETYFNHNQPNYFIVAKKLPSGSRPPGAGSST